MWKTPLQWSYFFLRQANHISPTSTTTAYTPTLSSSTNQLCGCKSLCLLSASIERVHKIFIIEILAQKNTHHDSQAPWCVVQQFRSRPLFPIDNAKPTSARGTYLQIGRVLLVIRHGWYTEATRQVGATAAYTCLSVHVHHAGPKASPPSPSVKQNDWIIIVIIILQDYSSAARQPLWKTCRKRCIRGTGLSETTHVQSSSCGTEQYWKWWWWLKRRTWGRNF